MQPTPITIDTALLILRNLHPTRAAQLDGYGNYIHYSLYIG